MELFAPLPRLLGMGRPKRPHYPNAVYHVMGRGNGGQPIFRNDDDRLVFLGLLEDVTRKTGCRVLFLCLMGNHFHLVLQVGNVPLSAVMQRFLCRYSRHFNIVHKRRGHVFQSRFKAKLCSKNAYLITLIRYIVNNPVKAGLVRHPLDWPWSSHRQYLGGVRSTLIDVESGLALLDSDPAAARRRYSRLIEEEDSGFSPRFDAEQKAPPKPKTQKSAASLEKIASELRNTHGLDFVGVSGSSRSRALSGIRREFAALAVSEGHSKSAVARFLGIHPSAVAHYGSLT